MPHNGILFLIFFLSLSGETNSKGSWLLQLLPYKLIRKKVRWQWWLLYELIRKETHLLCLLQVPICPSPLGQLVDGVCHYICSALQSPSSSWHGCRPREKLVINMFLWVQPILQTRQQQLGSLFTKRYDVLSYGLAKSWSPKLGCRNYGITLEFDTRHASCFNARFTLRLISSNQLRLCLPIDCM